MNRRQFLILSGCAGGLGLAGISFAEQPDAPRIVTHMPMFIGFGGAGVNFLRALPSAPEPDACRYPCITAELDRTDGNAGAPLPDNERARILDTALFPQLRNEVARVIVMAGLSRSGGGMAIEVARRYRQAGAEVSVVATLPFLFEGRRWRAPAERQRDALHGVGCDLVIVDNAAVCATLPDGTSLRDAYAAADAQVARAAIREAWPDPA